MLEEPSLEAQAVSKVVEIGLSSQLDQVENIDVDVQTDVWQIIQGQANSMTLVGRGLVIHQNIRVQEIELYLDKIEINPFSILSGKLQLNQPVNATTRIVMTESDINHALSSDYIKSQMQNLELQVDGERVKIQPQHLELQLPGDDSKMVCNGTMLLHQTGNARQVSFTSVFRPRTHSEPVILEQFNCYEGRGISLDLTIALMQQINKLVKLPYLDLETMRLQIQDLQVEQGKLTINAAALVKQLP